MMVPRQADPPEPRTLKIVFLNTLHEPHDKRVYQKIGVSLARAGHEVWSVAPVPAPGTHAPLPEPGEPDGNGIRFLLTPPAATKWRRFLALFRLVREGMRLGADAWCAPEPESWVAALALKALRGGRVVLDMHEHIPTEFAKFFPAPVQGFMTWLTVRFMRLFARYTDLIILTRESFETPWEGLPTPRVTIINTNPLQPPCADIPAALSERFAGRPVLIHQGVFGDVRGSWKLLEAMKLLIRRIPEVRCVVLGQYVYGDGAAYRRAVEEAGLAENLLLLPTVPYEAVPAHIAVAAAGLVLFQPGPVNHTLAMPHKLFDYMREGKPVIAPAFAVEVRRIVEEADCGLLVDVTDPAAIADAAHRLLTDPAEAARLGTNGRRIVEEKYNWGQEEKVLLDAFRRLEGR